MTERGLPYKDRDFKASAFERVCDRCDGEGTSRYYPGDNPNDPCPICKGTGTIPTSHGEELLAFLKRHGAG